MLADRDEERDEGRGRGAEREKQRPGLRSREEKAEKNLQPWCVGVLIEGNVYLFDPLLGLPIPAPNGVTRDAAGQLAIQPATLAQVAADDKLLRRLDVDENHAYGVKASELTRVTALLEASPPYLARRMKLLESQSDRRAEDGSDHLALDACRQWREAKHVAEARLWLQPFQTLRVRSHLTWPAVQALLRAALPLYMVYEEPVVVRHQDENEEDRRASETRTMVHGGALGHGRVLQLKGKFSGDDGATRYYQIARPSNELLVLSSADPGEKARLHLGQAGRQLLVRPDRLSARQLRRGHRLLHEPNAAGLSRRPLDQRRAIQSRPRLRGLRRDANGPSSNTAATTPRPATSATCCGRNGSRERPRWQAQSVMAAARPSESPDPQPFEPDLILVAGAVQIVQQPAVTPLQHAHLRLEEVPHARPSIPRGFRSPGPRSLRRCSSRGP